MPPYLKTLFEQKQKFDNFDHFAQSDHLKLGLNFCHLHLPDHQFENECFKEIKDCYLCYAMNSHLANKCSKPPYYEISSNCSSKDHIWSNCTSATVKCVNCGGPHVTRSPSCRTRKDLLKVNQHPFSKFTFYKNDLPCLINSPPQANEYKSCVEEEPKTSIPKNFEKYAAVDIVYKTMTCFGIAHGASSGDRNRSNKNVLNLLKENEIPKVYMNSIDLFLPSNPPSSVLCFSGGASSPSNLPSPTNLSSPTNL